MEDQDRMEKYVELVRRYGQLKLPDHDKEMILILQLHRLEGEMDYGDVIDAIAECVCDDSVLDQ